MSAERDALPGYDLTVEAGAQRWTWALSTAEARIAARGEAPSRETAHRTGLFAANAIEALRAVGRRRF